MNKVSQKTIRLIKSAIDFFDGQVLSKVDLTTKDDQTVYVDPLGSSTVPKPNDNGHNRYDVVGKGETFRQEIYFQDGSPSAKGINGLSNEAAISVVLHRLVRQNESYPSPYNTLAIMLLQGAMSALHMRVEDRKSFGIYDTDKVDPEGEEDAVISKALAITNSVGILSNIIFRFDSAYSLAHDGRLIAYLQKLSEYTSEDKDDLNVVSALSLLSTAIMGSGIFGAFAVLTREVTQARKEADATQKESTNGEQTG